MSEKALKFNNIKVNKKEFHKSKQAIDLDSVDTNKIVVSDKFKQERGKNMSFLIKYSEVWEKYEEIWNVIKNKLNIKFHSQPIYENKYLKAKVREFNGSIKTNFLGNNVPKENTTS